VTPDTHCRLPYVRDLTHLDLTPQDRAALVVYIFETGGAFTTAEIAQAFGMSVRGALSMLTRLSRVVPLVRDNGMWGMMSKRDQP